MPDVFIPSTLAGANNIAHTVACLHQLPRKAVRGGGGIHAAIPDEFVPGRAHPGWSTRPYPNVRRLHPTLDQWGTLVRTDTQALWADPMIRVQRLDAGQIQSFDGLFATAQALNATWSAGTPQPELHNVGHKVLTGADPSGVGNSTAAVVGQLAGVGQFGTLEVPPGQYKVTPEQIVIGQRALVEQYPGSVRFFAASPGAWLGFADNECTVQGMWDGNDIVEDSFRAHRCSVTFAGGVRRATRYGFHNYLGRSRLEVYAELCGSHGVYLFGSNDTQVESIRSVNNQGFGLEIVGSFDHVSNGLPLGPGAETDPLLTSGGVTIHDANLEQNQMGMLRMRGVEGGFYEKIRGEGPGQALVIYRSHGIDLRGMKAIGGSTAPGAFAVDIVESRGCIVNGVNLAIGAGVPSDYYRIRLKGRSRPSTGANNKVTDNFLLSEGSPTDLPIIEAA